MGIFLDVLTVAVFILTIYHAYKKGLLKAVIELLGFVVSYIVAFALSDPLGAWINKTFLNKIIHGTIAQTQAEHGTASQTVAFTKFLSGFPSAVANSLKNVTPQISSIGAKTADSIVDAVTKPLADVISRGIAFFIILALCLFLVRIVARLSDTVFHIPVIGTLNSLGGALVGVAEAMLIMIIISTLVSLMVTLFALEKNPPVTSSAINSTYIFKYVHNVNPLTGILLKK